MPYHKLKSNITVTYPSKCKLPVYPSPDFEALFILLIVEKAIEVYLSIYITISIYLSNNIYLFIYQLIYLSIYLFIYLPIYLSIYLGRDGRAQLCAGAEASSEGSVGQTIHLPTGDNTIYYPPSKR